MHITSLSVLLALSAAAAASDAGKTLHKAGQSPAYLLARSPTKSLYKNSSTSHLMARQSSSGDSGDSGSAGDSDYCYGQEATCASCFGSNWAECPDGFTCYDTTDPTSTCDDSSSSGSDGSGDSGDGSSGSDGSSGGSAGDSDTCYTEGATCESCFGSGYTECPGDDYYCYDPSDPTTSCPDDSSSASASGFASPTVTDFGTISSTSGASATGGLGGLGSIGGSSKSSSTTSASVASATHTSSSSTGTSSSSSSPQQTGGSVPATPLRLSAGVGAAAVAVIALL